MIFQKFQMLFEKNIASNVTKNQESKHITNIITHTKLLETVLNHVVVIPSPWFLVYAVFVAIQKPCKLKSMSNIKSMIFKKHFMDLFNKEEQARI